MNNLRHLYQKACNGEAKRAYQEIQELSKLYPNHHETWYVRSLIAEKLRYLHDAINSQAQAIDSAPDNNSYKLRQIRLLLSVNKDGQALDHCYDLEKHKNTLSPQEQCELGNAFNRIGFTDRALQLYQAAHNTTPDNPDIKYNLAVALRACGELVAAEKLYNQVLQDNPGDYEAMANRSYLRKQSESNNYIAELKVALEKADSYHSASRLLYALGKSYEDLKHYSEAFSFYEKASKLRRANTTYSVDTDSRVFEQIRNTFDDEFFSSAKSCENLGSGLIFIVGLPRSGTTLFERVLSSHSDVTSIGERNDFSLALIQLCKQQSKHECNTQTGYIEQSRKLNYDDLGKLYLQRISHLTKNNKVFIDKLPFNYLYAGLIAKSLPQAKIVCVRRNPLDSCFAMFKTPFVNAYPFSYCLQDLAHYYNEFHHLCEHWKDRISSNYIELQYEDMIAKQLTTSKSLIDFCDLEWQDACYNFHENKAISSTASASQVRQPIYNSSVNNWINYKDELLSLHEKLKQLNLI